MEGRGQHLIANLEENCLADDIWHKRLLITGGGGRLRLSLPPALAINQSPSPRRCKQTLLKASTAPVPQSLRPRDGSVPDQQQTGPSGYRGKAISQDPHALTAQLHLGFI